MLVQQDIAGHELPIVTFHAQLTKDPFRVLVATVLSLRTKDQVTAIAARRLFARVSTPKEIIALKQEELEKLIYPVGFYRTKAAQLREISRILLDEHAGAVPASIEEMTRLPGVGRKTANLVMILGFGQPAMCVDTHVHRISNRWGYVKTKNPDETEMALRALLPKQHWMTYNDFLVSFGQHRCYPISPRCSDCPLRRMCPRLGVTVSR
jgi:endonuclease-3